MTTAKKTEVEDTRSFTVDTEGKGVILVQG